MARAVRALRRRRGWRQADLGARAGLSRDVVSRIERGAEVGVPLGTLERVVAALDARLVVDVWWRGERLDRLLDAAHASLVETAARRLALAGWTVRAEVSFSHFGERGRYDLLARHPASGVVLVVEVKSAIGDLQETLGRLDAKARLAGVVSADIGWGRPASVVPALAVRRTRTAERVVAAHRTVLSSFVIRGRAVGPWIRRPDATSGLLWWLNAPDAFHARIAPSRPPATSRRARDV